MFSTISQACSLNFFPPVYMVRTSEEAEGQTYLPHLNQFIMLISLSIVTGFHSLGENNNIVEVYGIALALLMTTTTILYILTLRYHKNYSWWKLIPGFIFLSWDIVFVLGTASDVELQGWPAMTVAVFFGFIMFSWVYGNKKLRKQDKYNQAIFFQDEEHNELLNSSAKGEKYLKASEEKERDERAPKLSEAFYTKGDLDLEKVVRGGEGMGVFVSTADSKFGIPEVFSSVIKFTRWVPQTSEFLSTFNLQDFD